MTTETPDTAAVIPRPVTRVLFVLPPDFHAPEEVLRHRFAPLGPAVVAAALAPLGAACRAVDLAALMFRQPPRHDVAGLDEPDALDAHLRGERDEPLGGLVEEMFAHLEPHRHECDVVAISVDRGSQVPVAALVGREIKRRWGVRIISGGVAQERLRAVIERAGVAAIDVATGASTPEQIRTVFSALMELPRDRVGPPLEPNGDVVQLIRGGMRKALPIAGLPLPDFGIYDLRLYRRPLTEGSRDELLVLPYYFAQECQFSCAFCQTGGNQEAKPAEEAARDLAALAERWGVREFLFFNAQSNLLAPALSRALLAARLDLRWSDSYRVRPREPGDLELMARAGCASLTVGVESGSDRVLKAMVKGHRVEHASEMVREAHGLEIFLRVNVLTCFPGETREDLDATCRWIEEHATAIDDLAPSSFYLTADSPLGRNPERHGIVVRGPRRLLGVTKFRKSPDSLAFDEVGGMRWEEREPLLAESEALVRAAWERGRAGRGLPNALAPDTMLGLRRRHDTKAAAYEALRRPDAATRPRAHEAGATLQATPPRRVKLGRTDVEVSAVGVGTRTWGDAEGAGYGREFGPGDVVDAFGESVDAGLDFFDTAETFARGESEKILGWMARKRGGTLVLATKFALLPGRDGARALPRALEASLRRLGVPRVDLYQVHWPDAARASIESLMDALADAAHSGRVRAVGVCNFSAAEMRAAHAALARRGIALATNQVHYSLLHRAPEVDGVLQACRELGVTLLAHTPLEDGVLAGADDSGRAPAGPQGRPAARRREHAGDAAAVVRELRAIGAAHGGRPPAQVALNWLRARGAVPVAGARRGGQAAENAGALAFALDAEEVERLDRVAEAGRR